jgi:hypothetical protein
MLKCRIFLLLLLGCLPVATAQIPSPVKWTFTVIPDGKEAELVFTAVIKTNYHVYSQDISPDAGPIPTSFTFEPSKQFELSGKVAEGKATEYFDPNFGVNLKYFSDTAVFRQKIKLIDTNPFAIKGVVTFMVCDDKRCYPPEDVAFNFAMNESLNQSK